MAKKYEGIGRRGIYLMGESLGGMISGVEKTYVENLKEYGVSSVSISISEYNRRTKSAQVHLTLSFAGKTKKSEASWSQYVDESSIDMDESLLRAYCQASDEEITSLDVALYSGREFKELEPEFFDAMAREYAARMLPNEMDGGEWMVADKNHVVSLFGLDE